MSFGAVPPRRLGCEGCSFVCRALGLQWHVIYFYRLYAVVQDWLKWVVHLRSFCLCVDQEICSVMSAGSSYTYILNLLRKCIHAMQIFN